MNETIQKSMFSTLGLVSVAVLLLAVIALSNTMLRGLRLDLTENQLYTLSDGTRSILQKIDEPINLYFFYSKGAAQDITNISIYAKHVRESLEEMTELADGKLKLTVIDPEPFSDEEDRAVQLGVQAIPLSNGAQTLYFGLAATNAVGDTAVIPFFSTDRQSLLEYDLTKLVYQLSQAQKPVVGLLSTLNIDGGFDARRMQAKPPWIVLEQLRQFFEVRNLETDIETVPQDIDLLVLAHPADLNPATLYAIDQFVLRGGNLLVLVDPYAESVTALTTGDQGVAPQSDLSPLLSAWGVRLRPNEVLGDALYALRVTTDPSKPPARHYAMLGVRGNSLNQDDVITRGLEGINLAFAGIMEPMDDSRMDFTPLITSSDKAMPLPSFRVQPGVDPAELQRGFRPSGETYVLAARISGRANSAYADGPPAAEDPATGDKQNAGSEDSKTDQTDKKEETADNAQTTPQAHIGESVGPINVVVIADTDLLTDRLWVRLDNFFGRQIATPFADNADLVINAVDNLLGSSDLISIRSRAGYSRPFERVDALRLEAESRFRVKEQELQARLQETERKINELQRQKGEGGSAIVLDAEQQEAIKGFQKDLIQTRKELRSVRHELNKNIENLGTALKFINIVLVPLLLSIGVIIFILLRRRREVTAMMGDHA